MGFYVYKNDNEYPGYHQEYIVDTRMDMHTIPRDCATGSLCLVIEDGSVWILNTLQEWKELLEDE